MVLDRILVLPGLFIAALLLFLLSVPSNRSSEDLELYLGLFDDFFLESISTRLAQASHGLLMDDVQTALYRARAAALRQSFLSSGKTFSPLTRPGLSSVASIPNDRNTTAQRLCASLQGKTVLMVGHSATHQLHRGWLDALAEYDRDNHPCYGAQVCSWHHICRGSTIDPHERRSVAAPTREDLLRTESSLLRYFLSTSLHPSTRPDDSIFNIPHVDPSTGVRMRESQWIGRSRSADVIILGRGPIPAPAQTFTSSGNWSFIREIDRSKPLPNSPLGLSGNPILPYLEAAARVTDSLFLPSVLHTLDVLNNERSIHSRILIWHGDKYSQPKTPGVCITTLKAVFMQHKLLVQLLPYYGVIFVPLESPYSSRNPGTAVLEHHFLSGLVPILETV
ncbi:hypothetical protein HGRIS_002406 [Hohenbuehelia grisea]|uniref:Uncharacterized protein n=1 Tax=Hohenbuehelia grisea TaxID=104357 RepID=A0ABR3JLL7_9AGAR